MPADYQSDRREPPPLRPPGPPRDVRVGSQAPARTTIRPHPFSYIGRRAELAGIGLSNALLNIVTIGFYRFWGRTRIRRYIWSHVAFLGDRFAYLGTGRELFLGFLLAVGVLFLWGLVQGAASLFVTGDAPYQTAVSPVFLAALYFLLQIAIWRARRYRLSRTTWRGIRGGQSGGAIRYAFVVIGYTILTVITFGLAAPVARFGLFRWKMTRTYVGSVPLSVVGSSRRLYGRWLALYLIAFLSYAAVMAIAAVLIAGVMQNQQWIASVLSHLIGLLRLDASRTVEVVAIGVVILGLLLTGAPIAAIVWTWYRCFEFRYFVSCTRLNDWTFQSQLLGRSIAMLYCIYALVLALFAVALAVGGLLWLGLDRVLLGLQLGSIVILAEVIAAGVVAYILFSIFSGVLRQVVLMHGLLNRIFGTLVMHGTGDVAAILQTTIAAPRHGEGVLEALDGAEI